MTAPVRFTVEHLCRSTSGRVGRIELARGGVIQTPVFMPVGTQAAIRGMAPLHLRDTGAQIILGNTYHLHQRPGEAIVEKLGGLHKFMGVDLPILTDSGGFQVFSLDKKVVSEDGVGFSYELDGKQTFLSPERSMAIQQQLGSDIAMAFDECLEPDASRQRTELSVDMTSRWAERCVASHTRADQSLFGIVQGGMFPDLRKRSVDQITGLGFDGFAIGGLSVGEGPEKMNEILGATMPHMPPHLPRYLMGVGRPQDLVDGVAVGVDMFDCVIPTRHARSGSLYTFQGRIRITHTNYRRDAYPIDTACSCYTCKNFSRAYLHHLFSIGEILGATLATIHNLTFYGDLMARIRAALANGTFAALRKDIKALYPEKSDAPGPDEWEARQRGARERMARMSEDIDEPQPQPQPSQGDLRQGARRVPFGGGQVRGAFGAGGVRGSGGAFRGGSGGGGAFRGGRPTESPGGERPVGRGPGGRSPMSSDRGPAPSGDRHGPAPLIDRRGPPPSGGRGPAPSGGRGPAPSGDRRGPAPSGDRRGPASSGDRRGPAPSGDRRGPAPSGDRRGPAPSGDRRGPASSGDRRGPAPSGDRRGPAPSGDRRGPAPSGDRRGPAPSGDRRGPAPSGDRRGPAPSGGGRGPAPSGGGRAPGGKAPSGSRPSGGPPKRTTGGRPAGKGTRK